MIAFGPVPSRRLGRSLGINNIPPKVCTYSCVYCQVGRTTEMRAQRRVFYAPEAIAQDVQDKVDKAREAGEPVDYLTFVPDGEPTLDIHLGRRACQIMGATVGQVEYLIGYEGDAFAFTGDVAGDLLSITAVHPMRERAVDELLARAGASWAIVHELIAREKLVDVVYMGHRFYVRKRLG